MTNICCSYSVCTSFFAHYCELIINIKTLNTKCNKSLVITSVLYLNYSVMTTTVQCDMKLEKVSLKKMCYYLFTPF